MANQARFGFTPVQASSQRFQPRKYVVASGYTPINSCAGVAPGEVVSVAAAGNGQVIIAAPNSTILGVVAAVSYKDTTGVRVYGGYIPAGTTYTGDSATYNTNAAYVWVWDDPAMEYLAEAVSDSGTPLTEYQKVFANMDLSATSSTSVDTFYKRSLRTLTGTENTTNTFPFRVTELLRSPSQDFSATSNLRFKVQINNGFHPFYQTTGI
jgi:hypothetical protein